MAAFIIPTVLAALCMCIGAVGLKRIINKEIE